MDVETTGLGGGKGKAGIDVAEGSVFMTTDTAGALFVKGVGAGGFGSCSCSIAAFRFSGNIAVFRSASTDKMRSISWDAGSRDRYVRFESSVDMPGGGASRKCQRGFIRDGR